MIFAVDLQGAPAGENGGINRGYGLVASMQPPADVHSSTNCEHEDDGDQREGDSDTAFFISAQRPDEVAACASTVSTHRAASEISCRFPDFRPLQI
ncbi:MAG: hypothetical protein M5U16_04840 [Hyphomicrobium sp.]|nr:hypothetical protein [Hyphomicrobium sp.]